MKREKGKVVGQCKKYQGGDAQRIHTFDHPLFMPEKKITAIRTFKSPFTMGIADLDKFVTLMTAYDLSTHFSSFSLYILCFYRIIAKNFCFYDSPMQNYMLYI
jgi:hypothetical protein